MSLNKAQTQSHEVPLSERLQWLGETWQGGMKFSRRYPLGAVGAAITVFFAVIAIAGPVFATHDPLSTSRAVLAAPSTEHFFGTDHIGRDIFSRVIYGARISIMVGLASVIISMAVGSALGVAAGYFRGIVDNIVMRLMDTLMAFPSLIFALALMAMLGPSIRNVIIAIGVTQVASIARVVRSHVLSVREEPFVEAAHSLGADEGRIVRRHILPNVMSTIIIYGSTNLGYAILTEGTLSFLGVGVPPPSPSWGGMVSGESRQFLTTAPWMAAFPVTAISMAILGAMLLGDALRDALDPRLRGR